MKRNLLFASLLYFFILTAQSQIVAKEGKMVIKKSEKTTSVIELPYPPEVVEEAIKNHLALKGVKQDKSKGYQVFRGVKLYESDGELNDLHFKVERKSKKEKNISVVHLIVAKPGEDIALKKADNRHNVDGGVSFLNNMVPSIDSHNLNVDIEKQEENVKKSEKKLKELENEREEIEKKIKNLQEKLEENKRNQAKQADEITKQKNEYEALKARKKQ